MKTLFFFLLIVSFSDCTYNSGIGGCFSSQVPLLNSSLVMVNRTNGKAKRNRFYLTKNIVKPNSDRVSNRKRVVSIWTNTVVARVQKKWFYIPTVPTSHDDNYRFSVSINISSERTRVTMTDDRSADRNLDRCTRGLNSGNSSIIIKIITRARTRTWYYTYVRLHQCWVYYDYYYFRLFTKALTFLFCLCK